jgi:hypothetical protein
MKHSSKLGIAFLLLIVSSLLIAGFLYVYSETALLEDKESNDQATRKE